MQISFIILMLALLAVPVWTNRVYRDVYALEKAQIATDNVGIKLGGLDRSFFNLVELNNKMISSIDKVHHIFHACKWVPKTALFCLQADRVLEKMIKTQFEITDKILTAYWKKNVIQASYQALKLKVPICKLNRPKNKPLIQKRCPICHLKTSWQIKQAKFQYQIEDCAYFNRKSKTKLILSEQNKWKYQLIPNSKK